MEDRKEERVCGSSYKQELVLQCDNPHRTVSEKILSAKGVTRYISMRKTYNHYANHFINKLVCYLTYNDITYFYEQIRKHIKGYT